MAADVIPIPLSPLPPVFRTELPLASSGARLQRGLALWCDVHNSGGCTVPERLLAYPELTNDYAAVFGLNTSHDSLRPIFVGLGLQKKQIVASMDAIATNFHIRPIAYSCSVGPVDRFSFIVLPFEGDPAFFACLFEA